MRPKGSCTEYYLFSKSVDNYLERAAGRVTAISNTHTTHHTHNNNTQQSHHKTKAERLAALIQLCPPVVTHRTATLAVAL